MSLIHTGTGDLFVFTVMGKAVIIVLRATLTNSYFIQQIHKFKALGVVSFPPHQPSQLLICSLVP